MVGRTVSHYRVEAKLGGGGMGVVYRAEDVLLKRRVALKFLPPAFADDDEAKQRFIQEARAASALDDPHIGSVLDIAETKEGRLFIVMPFYEGETLKEKLAHGPLPTGQAIDVAVQIAEGLACAHEAGIVHRDIKPANVMITEGGVVKIVDFGLAKLDTGLELTRTGTTIGTAYYMSPEQASGGAVDTRSDLWSTGVVLYEMLTGRRPFEAEYEQAVLYAVVHRDAVSIDDVRSGVSEGIVRIVERLLRKDPQDRYGSAAELLQDLEQQRNGIPKTFVASESRGEHGSNSSSRWIYVAAAVFSAAVLATAYVFLTETDSFDKIDALAVLPLANLSVNSEEQYFADGMTDALIAHLAQIERLKVISRQSVMRFKDSEAALQEIAGWLGVDAVLAGTVLSVGGDVRVTAQLIDGRTDEHLWAKSYERPMEGILDLQREIALDVAKEIDAQLHADEHERLTTRSRVDPTAYRLYLRGREMIWRFDAESRQSAIHYLERSIAHDSTFAPAYAELTLAYEDDERADGLLQRALQLDPNHPDVLLARGKHAEGLDATERLYRRALEVEPGHSLIRRELGWLLLWQGRPKDAARQMQHALELDPLAPHAHHSMAAAHFFNGDYDRAETRIEACLDLEPSYWMCRVDAYETAIQKGDYDKAVESANELAIIDYPLSPQGGRLRAELLRAATEAEKTEVLARADASMETDIPAFWVARLYAAAGRSEPALEHLEVAVVNGDHTLYGLVPHLHPDFKILHGDARFEGALDRFYGRGQ